MKDERHVGHFVVLTREKKTDEGSWYIMTRRASDDSSAGGQLRRERGHPGVHFQVVRARV